MEIEINPNYPVPRPNLERHHRSRQTLASAGFKLYNWKETGPHTGKYLQRYSFWHGKGLALRSCGCKLLHLLLWKNNAEQLLLKPHQVWPQQTNHTVTNTRILSSALPEVFLAHGRKHHRASLVLPVPAAYDSEGSCRNKVRNLRVKLVNKVLTCSWSSLVQTWLEG